MSEGMFWIRRGGRTLKNVRREYVAIRVCIRNFGCRMRNKSLVADHEITTHKGHDTHLQAHRNEIVRLIYEGPSPALRLVRPQVCQAPHRTAPSNAGPDRRHVKISQGQESLPAAVESSRKSHFHNVTIRIHYRVGLKHQFIQSPALSLRAREDKLRSM